LEPEVRELFEGPNYAHVASLLPDGSPHSVAVWVGLKDDRPTFFTQTGSLKAKNLERDPRVAISITDHENPYKTARVRGTVVEKLYGDEALAAMDVISHKYTGQDFPVRGPNGVLFVVEPEKASHMQLPFEHKPG
jgi:PPOX class probable F420-dependent enzyme